MKKVENDSLAYYQEVEVKLLKHKGYEMYFAIYENKNSRGKEEFCQVAIRKDREIKIEDDDNDLRKYAIGLVLNHKERLDNNEILKFVVDAGGDK